MKKENNENRFYVYVYLDPRKPGKYVYGEYSFDYEPFYVGKGKGKRIYAHLKESVINKNTNKYKINKIKKILKETSKNPIILKIRENLSENDAFVLETYFIEIIGRIDLKKGPLTNLTNGGDGPSNQIVSDETKEKLRIINTGKKLSNETKNKMSKARSNGNIWNFGKKGKESPIYGIKRSEETKTKMRNVKIKEKNPNYGKKASKSTKEKMSKAHRGITTIGKYKITDPNGIIYYTENGLSSFCEKHNLSRICMSQIMRGKQKQHKGWICELIELPSNKI